MTTPTTIAAYLALFAAVGFIFLFVNLLVGRFLRPNNPSQEKGAIYECGEPTIGSSFVQFDLRFYVIALVFIVFDAEVAFLFPVSTVFGKSTNLADRQSEVVETSDGVIRLSPDAAALQTELGLSEPVTSDSENIRIADQEVRRGATQLAWIAFWTINIFFIILLIGFAYEWKTGSLDWVRAVTRERFVTPDPAPGVRGGASYSVLRREPIETS